MIVGTEDVPTGENLILSASFEKEGMEPTLRDRDAVALPRRHEGRRGQDQDPARRVRDRRLGALRRPPQRRAGHRRLPRRVAVRLHRRDDQPGRRRRQRRAVRRPRAPGRDADQVAVERAERSAELVARHGDPQGDRRLRRAGDGRGRAGLRPARRADRGLRQRRHALVREADADRARLHPDAARRDGRGGRVAARRSSRGRPRTRRTTRGSARRSRSTTTATTAT